MALPTSPNQISFSQINSEFTNDATGNGVESALTTATVFSGATVIPVSSTSNLNVGAKSLSLTYPGVISSLGASTITMSSATTGTINSSTSVSFFTNQMSQYYAGGDLGVSGTIPNVPTSGEIRFSDFHGAVSGLSDFPAPTYTFRKYDGTFNSQTSDSSYKSQDSSFSTNPVTLTNSTVRLRLTKTSTGSTLEFGSADANDLHGYYTPSGTYTSLPVGTGYYTGASLGSVPPDAMKWTGTTVYSAVAPTSANAGQITIASSLTGTYQPAQDTWQTLNTNDTVVLTHFHSTSSSSTQPSVTVYSTVNFKIWLRKTGYNDSVVYDCTTSLEVNSENGGGGGPKGPIP